MAYRLQNPYMDTNRRLSLIAFCALAWASCIGPGRRATIFVSTTPPGARIMVDGMATGMATPATLEIGVQDSRLTLELEGYRTSAVLLFAETRIQPSPLGKGDLGPGTPRMPLFLPATDLLIPVRVERRLAPARIHVALQVDRTRSSGP